MDFSRASSAAEKVAWTTAFEVTRPIRLSGCSPRRRTQNHECAWLDASQAVPDWSCERHRERPMCERAGFAPRSSAVEPSHRRRLTRRSAMLSRASLHKRDGARPRASARGKITIPPADTARRAVERYATTRNDICDNAGPAPRLGPVGPSLQRDLSPLGRPLDPDAVVVERRAPKGRNRVGTRQGVDSAPVLERGVREDGFRDDDPVPNAIE
jgi:hypothetical protein